MLNRFPRVPRGWAKYRRDLSVASKSTILCDNRGLQLLYHSITQFVFIFASLSDTSGSDLPFVMFNPRAWFSITHEQNIICSKTILVPRGRAPFGQHQESRPLASQRSNDWHSREHARDLSTSGQFPSSSHKIPRSTSATRAISVLSSIILPLQKFFSRVLLLRQQPFSCENLKIHHCCRDSFFVEKDI